MTPDFESVRTLKGGGAGRIDQGLRGFQRVHLVRSSWIQYWVVQLFETRHLRFGRIANLGGRKVAVAA